jgi:hypothetical protein
VIPIPKKRESVDADNYQTITLVSALSKVSEEIIATQLISFINKHNVFSNIQVGFGELISTKEAIALFVDDVIGY